jgi:hypothetical protein
VGRDPSEIETSVMVRYDPATGPSATAEAAAMWADAGVDIAVVYLPTPHRADALEPIAEALAPLRD